MPASCPSAMICAGPSAARWRCARPGSASAAASRRPGRGGAGGREHRLGDARPGHAARRAKPGRRDYRIALPAIDDPDLSGTTAAGLLEALEALSGGALAGDPATRGRGRADDAARPVRRWPRAARDPVTLVANFATRITCGAARATSASCSPTCSTASAGRARRRTGTWGTSRASSAACAGPGGEPLRDRRHLSGARRRRRAPAAPGAAGGGARAPRHAGRRHDRGRCPPKTPRACAPAPPQLGLRGAIWDNGTVTGGGERMSAAELVALVCCDLGAIVRGRSLLASEDLDEQLQRRRRLGARRTTP